MGKRKALVGNEAQKMLRAMPVNVRAETIIGMFSLIVAEFAAMVLEHSTVAPARKRPSPRRRGVKRRR